MGLFDFVGDAFHAVVSMPGEIINDVGSALHVNQIISGIGDGLGKAESLLSTVVLGAGSEIDKVITAGTGFVGAEAGAIAGVGRGLEGIGSGLGSGLSGLGRGAGTGLAGIGKGAGGLLGSIGSFLPLIMIAGGGIALLVLLKR